MIAETILKPKSTSRQRSWSPIPESPISLGCRRDLTEILVDTLTLTKINNQTPRRTGGVSEQPCGYTVTQPFLRVGRELGRYRLLEWLGRGGEGDVWKAVRLEAIEEFVALKVLKPSLASNPARTAQFRREAERGVGLVGPSLLGVYELNEINGYHFMALPFVEGTALREVINSRHTYLSGNYTENVHHFVTMSEEDYLGSMTRTLAKAAHALASVHDQGVAHRDIKPANILLDNRRCEGVYLCDFGMGRDLEVATSEQMRDGAGTPIYMAPERLLRITADEIKCDVYSMGVTLCEALTLERPFQVPEHVPLVAVARFLARAEPRRPRDVDPNFPEELEAIIMKAMARDPRHRHASARALAGDLDRFAFGMKSSSTLKTLLFA
jgi:eukaryotic-like serine/threonine-protein kinase